MRSRPEREGEIKTLVKTGRLQVGPWYVLADEQIPSGESLLRNLLVFADGFFSFLVGAMLVALSENWQRLGDLAARTIVVADRKPA